MVRIVVNEYARVSVSHNTGANDRDVILQIRNRDAMLSVTRKIAAAYLDIRRSIRIKTVPTIPGSLAIYHPPL
jgi:hypothetical protein